MARENDEFRTWSKRQLEREVLKLRGLLGQQMAAAPGVGEEITVHGIVGIQSREPSVHMRAGEAAWQFTPAQARQHALIVLDAAVEAERDAATVAFLREMALAAGDSEEAAEQYASGFLVKMREERSDWLDEMRTSS